MTGAGSVGPGWGNGKATAVLFAREGAKVFAVDINLAAAEGTKSIIDKEEGICTVHKVDVSKSQEVKAMADRCIKTYGRIDILHNNVGIVLVGGPVDTAKKPGTVSVIRARKTSFIFMALKPCGFQFQNTKFYGLI